MSLFLLLRLMLEPQDVESLRASAPRYLDAESAADHLAAARAASTATGIRPEILLSVAWHESRYVSNVVTREPGHRVSCGVMTPEPLARCVSDSLPTQYMKGARHLAHYVDVYGSETAALRAYVGGGQLVRVCARRGVYRNRRGTNICDVWTMFQRRADEMFAKQTILPNT